MKLSTRNQIQATITALEKGAVNVRIPLMTANGMTLTSIITDKSADVMALKVGDDVIAFFKASHVMVAVGDIESISARNKLAGVVKNVTYGAVNAEVIIAIGDGDTIVSIITNESAEELGLKPEMFVIAIIKSSDVMIAKNI